MHASPALLNYIHNESVVRRIGLPLWRARCLGASLPLASLTCRLGFRCTQTEIKNRVATSFERRRPITLHTTHTYSTGKLDVGGGWRAPTLKRWCF